MWLALNCSCDLSTFERSSASFSFSHYSLYNVAFRSCQAHLWEESHSRKWRWSNQRHYCGHGHTISQSETFPFSPLYLASWDSLRKIVCQSSFKNFWYLLFHKKRFRKLINFVSPTQRTLRPPILGTIPHQPAASRSLLPPHLALCTSKGRRSSSS